MKAGLHFEGQLFVSANNRDRNHVTRGNEKGGIENIFRLPYFGAANLQHDIPHLHTGLGRWSIIHDLGGLGPRALHGRDRFRDIRADPAMPRFAETHKVAADFFRRFDR